MRDTDTILPIRAGFLALVMVLSVLASAGAVPAAAQSGQPTEISSCTTIDQPGQYVVGSDIQASDGPTCIDVQADDVVIDGAGYTISGQGSSGGQVGVSADSRSNVTVRNLELTDWATGVNFTSTTNGTVENVTARSNSVGIELAGSTGNTVIDNTVRDSSNGIFLHSVGETSADENTVSDNRVVNTSIAITFIGADNNTVTNNTLLDSRVYGLSLLFSADGNDYNEFRDNTIINSTEDAVCLLKSSHNTFENTYVEDSGRYDLYAVNGSVDNRAQNFTVTSLTMDFELYDTSFDAVDEPPATPDGQRAVGGYLNATDTSSTDSGYLEMTVNYTDEDIERANVDEETLAAYRYDGEWSEVEDSSVDTEANTLTANVTELRQPGSAGRGHDVIAPLAEATGPAASGYNESLLSPTNATTGTSDSSDGTDNSSADATDTADANSGDAGGTDATTATDGAGDANATGEPETGGSGDAQGTEASGPGFGLLVAIVALLGAALLAARRR